MATNNDRQSVQTQLVGEHWINSVLAALSAALQCGVSLGDAAASARRMPPFRGRMQPAYLPNGVTAISDQNASLDVFDAMLNVASSAIARRKILVLGDLNDTQENSTKARRALAGRRTADVFDLAIFYGSSAHRARKAAIDRGMSPEYVFCAEDLTEVDGILKKILRSGDLMFVKGQNFHHLQRVIYMQMGKISCTKTSCNIRSGCEICPHLGADFELNKLNVVTGLDDQCLTGCSLPRQVHRTAGVR